MPKKYTKAMTLFERRSLGLMWAALGMSVLGVVAQHGSDTLAYFKRVADATKSTYAERTSETSGPRGNREGTTNASYVEPKMQEDLNIIKQQMAKHEAEMKALRKQMDGRLYRTDVPFEAASKHPTQEVKQKAKNEN